MSSLSIFLLECAALIALPMIAWRYLGLRHVAPLAMIQIAIGLALGPSILGRLMPNMEHWLFPIANIPKLDGISTLAVSLFTFVCGMRLDEGMVAASGRSSSLTIAASGFLMPLVIGSGLGYWLAMSDPGLIGKNASQLEFAFGFGLCLSVTALPVLASILLEMGIVKSPLGQRALALAAMNDAISWTAVFVLITVVADSHVSFLRYFTLILAYLAGVLFVLPRLLQIIPRLTHGRQWEPADNTVLAVACALALCAAMFAEYIGLDYILGAFLGGVAMPAKIRMQLIQKLDWPVVFVMMPFFYIITGLRIEADLVSPALFAIVLSATGVAITGKILGVAIPLIAQGEPWRSSLALSALMQSKGLMEVVVITILTNAGIVGTEVFSVIILMAVVCTVAARPLTTLFMGKALTNAEDCV